MEQNKSEKKFPHSHFAAPHKVGCWRKQEIFAPDFLMSHKQRSAQLLHSLDADLIGPELE